MASLVKERQLWRKEMEAGTFEPHPQYKEYLENRTSDLWRSTRQLERLFEYIDFLEDMLNIRKALGLRINKLEHEEIYASIPTNACVVNRHELMGRLKEARLIRRALSYRSFNEWLRELKCEHS